MKSSLAVDLTDRVALVTGSSRGLGAATARRLATLGADVIVTYRREQDQAEEVATAARDAGRAAWVRELDVGEAKSVDALFDWVATADWPGTLDILVANAASTSLKPLIEQKRHSFAGCQFPLLMLFINALLPPADERGQYPAIETARVIIARQIIRGRKAAGWTQAELAAKAGVRQETISRIETGKHSPGLKTMAKIDRALLQANV